MESFAGQLHRKIKQQYFPGEIASCFSHFKHTFVLTEDPSYGASKHSYTPYLPTHTVLSAPITGSPGEEPISHGGSRRGNVLKPL